MTVPAKKLFDVATDMDFKTRVKHGWKWLQPKSDIALYPIFASLLYISNYSICFLLGGYMGHFEDGKFLSPSDLLERNPERGLFKVLSYPLVFSIFFTMYIKFKQNEKTSLPFRKYTWLKYVFILLNYFEFIIGLILLLAMMVHFSFLDRTHVRTADFLRHGGSFAMQILTGIFFGVQVIIATMVVLKRPREKVSIVRIVFILMRCCFIVISLIGLLVRVISTPIWRKMQASETDVLLMGGEQIMRNEAMNSDATGEWIFIICFTALIFLSYVDFRDTKYQMRVGTKDNALYKEKCAKYEIQHNNTIFVAN
ncbi:hypothetical protein LOD99_3305 [Oopsacas minuta]|uniref:CWH43-like N-terminal domain-containing protein n=1 Tax=Oopsacas minuta TaxID=111878 RepID=A0AAV7K0L0_9METZ|nr:hypothetical protein LOD99_3305 [Oopsacas minuta]